MSPLASKAKTLESMGFSPSAPAGCTAGCTSEQSEGGIPDAELAALVAAWPTLPVPIRAAIRALIGAAR